jgi:hypothetical protein
MMWGHQEPEWNELLATTAEFLIDRARLERTTSYTELNTVLTNRTRAEPFDFDTEHGRAAMGAVLGQVATDQFGEVGALVSSIVIYLNENDAGPGFYRMATNLNLLPARSTAAQKLDFWAGQVKAVFEHYGEASD